MLIITIKKVEEEEDAVNIHRYLLCLRFNGPLDEDGTADEEPLMGEASLVVVSFRSGELVTPPGMISEVHDDVGA